MLLIKGLAGLATAHALASTGHHVRVFEKYTEVNSVSATGVRITPNGSKILEQWGALDEFKKFGCKLPSCEFINRE